MAISIKSSFERLLAEALLTAETGGRTGSAHVTGKDHGFSTEKFFAHWFQDSGSAYFFLFKKNLRVTNIQMAGARAAAHRPGRTTKKPAHG